MKTTIMPLSKSSAGEKLKVLAIRLNKRKKRRISDLGILPGTEIKVLQKSPAGDPVAYFVRGTVIALRNEDAVKIIVETIPD